MNKRTFLTLSACIGVLWMFPVSAEEGKSIAKASLRDAQEFIVIADWIACYENNNGIPGENIAEVFYRDEQLQRQQRDYREDENRAYLRVKSNVVPDQGCFIEATTATISAVKTVTVDSSATENTVPADNIETPEPSNNTVDENSVAANDPAIDENYIALKEPAVLENNNAKSFTISCTAPGSSAVRQLKTSFVNAPSTLPCKVVYYREDGKTQVIADAKYTSGYCAEKRNAFLERLKGWGWQCEKIE